MADSSSSKRLLDPQEDVKYRYTGCFESCCARRRFILTHDELVALNMLRSRARIGYDGENDMHKVNPN